MAKTNKRYPEPLDTVLRELAGDCDVDRYTLETYIVASFVLRLLPASATEAEKSKLEHLSRRLAFTHPGLPEVVISVQAEITPPK